MHEHVHSCRLQPSQQLNRRGATGELPAIRTGDKEQVFACLLLLAWTMSSMYTAARYRRILPIHMRLSSHPSQLVVGWLYWLEMGRWK